MEQVLANVPTVAKMLGVGRSFAYQLVHDGTLPSVRLGERVLRVPVVEVHRYIERLQQEKENVPQQ